MDTLEPNNFDECCTEMSFLRGKIEVYRDHCPLREVPL